MKVITVPINKDAMKRLDYDESDEGDLIELFLDEGQYKELWASKVFNAFNEKMDMIIDDYEDESIITSEDLKISRDIVLQFIKKNPDNDLLGKVLKLIDYAILNKTGVFFYF